MTKILATTFGALLGLLGLGAFAAPTMLGMHGSALANLVNLLAGAGVVALAWRAGPSLQFLGCVGTAALYLLWGVAGFAFGRPGASTLLSMPPDLRLLVVIPGFLESGQSDHVLHLLAGLGLAMAAVAGVAETPFRLRK